MPQESSDHIHHDTITGRRAGRILLLKIWRWEYSILSSGDNPRDEDVGADLCCAEIGEEKGKAVTGDDKPATRKSPRTKI